MQVVILSYTAYHLLFPLIAYYLFLQESKQKANAQGTLISSTAPKSPLGGILFFIFMLFFWFYLIGLYTATFVYPMLSVLGILGILKLIALEFFFLDSSSVQTIKSSFRNYYVYLVAPAEIAFNPGPAKKNLLHMAFTRFCRGALQLSFLLLLNLFFQKTAFLSYLPFLLRGVCAGVQMSFLFAAATDLALAVLGLILPDVFLYDVFYFPILASSPREFWSKRWNLVTQKYVLKILYLPLGGKNNKSLAIVGVYLFVGIMHEIPMIFLPNARFGYWMLIFSIHIIGMLSQCFVEKTKYWNEKSASSRIGMRLYTLFLLSLTSELAYKGFGTTIEKMAVDINNFIFLNV